MSIFFHQGDIKSIIKRCPVACLLILANTIFLILTIYKGGLKDPFNLYNLYKLGGLVPAVVIQGEYERLVLAMFLHGSVMHFIFNIFFGILILGAGLEKLIGSVRFFLVYMLSGLTSSIFVLLFSERNTLTIGASGAIYGVMGVLLYIVLKRQHMMSIEDRNYIRSLLIINIIFTFSSGFISISGHLGGLVGGFILGMLILAND